MNLTEFVLLAQSELQKSHDYLRLVASGEGASGVLHFSFDSVELDVPVVLDVHEYAVPENVLSQIPESVRFMKMPFNLDAQLMQFEHTEPEVGEAGVPDSPSTETASFSAMVPGQMPASAKEKKVRRGAATKLRLLTEKDLTTCSKNATNNVSRLKINFKLVI